jgi:hypothetical protein
MESDQPDRLPNGGYRKPTKDKRQKNIERRQRRKEKTAARKQEHVEFRESFVALGNELLQASTEDLDKRDQIKALQTTSVKLGERVQELESALASETSARQRAERRAAYAEFDCAELHQKHRGARSLSSVRVGTFLKSLRDGSPEVSGQASGRTSDQV